MISMRTFLWSAIALTAVTFSGPVLAADLPMKAPPPPAPTWTGCYLDAGAGYGMWNQDQHQETFPGLATISATYTEGGRGWLGRVGGGCDYQFSMGGSNFVIGTFGDYDFMGLSANFAPGNLAIVGNERESGAWYAGARIGYLVTPTLLTYFDGGYTETRFDQVNFSSLIAPFAPTVGSLPATTYRGGFIGGGTEYAMTWLPIPGLFWRNEYRFSSYSAQDIPILAGGVPSASAEHIQKDVQTITTSLVWRFNWMAPLATKY
jgi:outer membrane immunogenic protein